MTTSILCTTELEAVNVILGTIGEAPLNTVENLTLPDAILALNLLRQATREGQSRGWLFNTEHEYPLPADDNGEVTLPSNVIQFRVAESQAADLNAVWRAGKVYDRSNHTFNIGATVKANLIFSMSFEDCPEAFRWYATVRAARKFLDRSVGNAELHGFQESDERDAEENLQRSEGDTGQYNVLTDNAGVFGALARNGRFQGSITGTFGGISGSGNGGGTGNGAQGPRGLKGDTGATGATGPAGPQGADGPAGPAGATGPAGPTGAAGSVTYGTAAGTATEGNDARVVDHFIGVFTVSYTASQILLECILPVAITIPANFAGSYAKMRTNPTANRDITITKTVSGTETTIGTITLGTGGSFTLSTQAAVTLAAGSSVAIKMPATVDATLANFGVFLKVTR